MHMHVSSNRQRQGNDGSRNHHSLHDQDSLTRGRRDVDVVDADSRSPDHLQLAAGADHALRHLSPGPDQQSVVLLLSSSSTEIQRSMSFRFK